MPASIDTLGHSNRPLADFLALLSAWRVEHIVDVRAFPRSRANPQFNIDTLPQSLAEARVAYTHAPALGGRRPRQPGADPGSNAGWEHSAFQNFADYARTPPFRAALDDLIAFAVRERAAIMCSEAVWWQCHRRIIADYLLIRGLEVRHLLSPAKAEPARLTPFARQHADGSLTYPPAEPGLFAAKLDTPHG